MIKIQNVNDAAYKRFGKVITDIELGDLLQAMEATPCAFFLASSLETL